jgi:hypothetical protein
LKRRPSSARLPQVFGREEDMAEEKDIQPITSAPLRGQYGDDDHGDEHKRAANRVVNDARLATEKEHNMTLLQGISKCVCTKCM